GPQHGGHRGGADDPRRQPALSVARRCRAGRSRAGAALFQAACPDDLARRRADVLGRRPVAVRPAVARRRAAARPRPDRAAAGGVSAVQDLHIKVLRIVVVLGALLAPSALWAVEPSEMLSDPALEARARTLSKELRCMV